MRDLRRNRSVWLWRVLSVIALLALLQPSHVLALACVGISSAAEAAEPPADDCCPDEQPADDEGGGHRNCPCPLPCAVGCGGQPRAIVTGTALPELIPLPVEVVFFLDCARTPQSPEPLGIMHVPKHALS